MNKIALREGWVSLLLLVAMGLCLAWTLQGARLADDIGVIQWVILAATLVGLALTRTNVPAWVSHATSMIIGSGWGVFLVALLLPGQSPWADRLQSMRLRIMDWGQQAVGGGESYDTLMFLLFCTILFWAFQYIAMYSIFRAHWVWGAILPNGTVVLMNAYYSPKLMPYFVSYLLLSLLLIVRYTLFEREDEWQRAKVRYSPDLTFDFLRDGAFSAVILIALAWLIPLKVTDPQDWKVWDLFEDPWQEVQFHWNRVFSSLSSAGEPRFSFFARSVTLGGAVNLGETPVMDVSAPDRYYWRALVFDEYTGAGWKNTDPEEIEIEANVELPLPLPYQDRHEITQTMSFYRPGEKMIFAANQMIRVNRRATVRLLDLGPGGSRTGAAKGSERSPVEISAVASKLKLRRNETYQVASAVSHTSVAALRKAGDDYPDWVRARYLQLPSFLPARVRRLAERLTAPHDNAYDKAVAIERYLRQIKYNEAIESPPLGVDVVDWFLFENREGYCDYYSTAMAVMLRTVGIPARAARGYAAGTYDRDKGVYTVHESDAHAWPEVYFPSYGWIEFEPTASEPLIVRPTEAGASTSSGAVASGEDYDPLRDMLPDEENPAFTPAWFPPTPLPWWQRTDWIVRLSPLLVILLAVAINWLIQRRRRASSTLITLAFDNMVSYAKWLGLQLSPHQTPYECSQAVGNVVDEGREDAQAIADLYVEERYGGHPLSVFEEMNAMDAWRRLREAIWVHLIIKRLPVKEETAQSLRSALRPTA